VSANKPHKAKRNNIVTVLLGGGVAGLTRAGMIDHETMTALALHRVRFRLSDIKL
jgi:hypothetical protein